MQRPVLPALPVRPDLWIYDPTSWNKNTSPY
uniref:Uncharacterized protein n=1 Tax=Anguilla anguilla TaxID=7936 RepID=A0A0E9QG98_ANGAN